MKEQISVRRLTLIVNATLLLLVLGLMYFFQLIDVSFLVWFSIPALLVYVLGFVLIFSGKFTFYANMVYFWLTLYMGITTVCLGHDYGFHLVKYRRLLAQFLGVALGVAPGIVNHHERRFFHPTFRSDITGRKI